MDEEREEAARRAAEDDERRRRDDERRRERYVEERRLHWRYHESPAHRRFVEEFHREVEHPDDASRGDE